MEDLQGSRVQGFKGSRVQGKMINKQMKIGKIIVKNGVFRASRLYPCFLKLTQKAEPTTNT